MHHHEYKKLLEDSGKPASRSPEAFQHEPGRSPAQPPPSHAPPGRYLRTPAASQYLGLSTSTLAKMRLRGDGPAYSKAGARIVVYDVADLDAYLAARQRRSTSEADAGVGHQAALNQGE
jgi:predicted DNA-binding transcriptional regulator AlpA